jgi:hypothetical protein
MATKTDWMTTQEETVKQAGHSIAQMHDNLKLAIGERPFGTQRVPDRVFVRQYQLVRNSPQAWAAIIQEQGPKAAVEYAERGERLSKRFPDEESWGMEAAEPQGPEATPQMAQED